MNKLYSLFEILLASNWDVKLIANKLESGIDCELISYGYLVWNILKILSRIELEFKVTKI